MQNLENLIIQSIADKQKLIRLYEEIELLESNNERLFAALEEISKITESARYEKS